jgi:hypothetical protein
MINIKLKWVNKKLENLQKLNGWKKLNSWYKIKNDWIKKLDDLQN